MNRMFYSCSSLTSLNLSNFNTSHVKTMSYMFYRCLSLTSLNLSNFDTLKVEDMNNMFYGCSSLTSLDLSNFDTSFVTAMIYMFYNCSNLEYINLYNFKENRLENDASMFSFIPENVVICINENIKKIFREIYNNIKCYTIDCSNDWKSKQKKIINVINECIESCNKSDIYKYEYNGKCYENCQKGFLYDNNNK